MTAAPVFRLARSSDSKKKVMRLRDLVYVQDQGRLLHEADMAASFDRFDSYADYILAEIDGEAVGTVKVVRDSPLGLPCEDVTDLTSFRHGHEVVELGHLMTVPTVRGQSIGMALMRAGLVHAVSQYGATRLVGDFFVDGSGQLRTFYCALGFVALSKPYADERFAGAPLSLVAGLDLADAADRLPSSTEKTRELLHFFFHDYAELRRGYLGQHASAADSPVSSRP